MYQTKCLKISLFQRIVSQQDGVNNSLFFFCMNFYFRVFKCNIKIDLPLFFTGSLITPGNASRMRTARLYQGLCVNVLTQ